MTHYNNVKFENGYFNYNQKINANARIWYWVPSQVILFTKTNFLKKGVVDGFKTKIELSLIFLNG